MSISQNFPNIQPTLSLPFALTKMLDPRITFTRAASAVYYDGKTVAKAEENLLLYSQEFDNAYWVKLRATITANSTTAPDGTTTADSLLQQSGETTSGLLQGLDTPMLAVPYVFSIFAKPDGKNFIRMVFVDVTAGNVFRECYFNVSTGAIGTANQGAVGSITAAADGFYRCSIAYTFSASGTFSPRVFIADTDNSTVVVDSGGLYLWGAQLEQRSSVTAYTPTTTQAITNYVPVLLTAASGVARFDHNPTTGESLGLLVEEQRTNLVTYSEQFDNAAWTKAAASITADAVVSPDGTVDADALIEDTANASHTVNQGNVTTSTTTASTLSFYAKAAGRSVIQVRYGVQALTNRGQGNVDLLTGATALVQNVGTATGTTLTATFVGNGWYRVAITTNPNDAAATQMRVTIILGNVAVGSMTGAAYTGDGYSGIYIWGAQLE